LDATAVIETSTYNRIDSSNEADAAHSFLPPVAAAELRFELGLWLSGLESFLNVRNHSFTEEARARAATRDWTREFRLTHTALLLCSRLAFQIEKTLDNAGAAAENSPVNRGEIFRLSQTLKHAVLLSEGLLHSRAPLRFAEWTAWCAQLSEKLKTLQIVRAVIAEAEETGGRFLPEDFKELLAGAALPAATRADLNQILPRFARILKWLSVVERMHASDEPLKPALLVFARVGEQIQELIKYVDNRLSRFPNEDDALFAALDGTAYTASIELRKVFNYELVGVADLRPAPAVYARIETALSLLTDSFQQTVVNFARLLEPNIEPTALFPNFQIKLRQSLTLRQDLWNLLQSVQDCEKTPEKDALANLHAELNEFLAASLHHLFYKDKETMERFIEEVLVTTDKKDLVPILHRFGAYIETLFGQVNMRTVLSKHPFSSEK
jgi:hypothetical protein